ncbi:MAG: polysaccharide biosynthesis/export family protein [Alphaproteobacteria bacterium]
MAALVMLAACAGPQLPASVSLPERFEQWDAAAQEYRFRPGDELDVRLIHNPEFSDRLTVAPDGQIAMPLIGFVTAAGKTPRELQFELLARFRRELRQPEVTVVPRAFAAQRVFVGGEVANPGIYDLPHEIGVLQAVVIAGGFRPTAREDSVVLIRRTPRETPMARLVNVAAVVHQGALDHDVPLRALDVVYVPRSGAAEVGHFIDQYIRAVLPFDRSITYSLN